MPTTESPVIARYLAQLAQVLDPLPQAEKADLLRELSSHFTDALAAGQAPEALVARMGSPEEVGHALLVERMAVIDRGRSARDLRAIVLRAPLRPFMLTGAAFLAISLANLLYLYGGILIREGLTLDVLLKLLAWNAPAVMVITLPVATFFAGLNGSRRVAEALSRPYFARLWPRFCGFTLAMGVLVSLAGAGLNDSLVVAANRKVGDWIRVDLQGQSHATPEARSPQELTRAELSQRIARQRAALREESATTREALIAQETQYHLKLALPFASLAMAALGLALGRVGTRRRWQRLSGLMELGVGGVVVGSSYLMLALGLGAAPLLGPMLGAWLPVLLLGGLAPGVWAIDAMSHPRAVEHA